jgi:hypothetical protein
MGDEGPVGARHDADRQPGARGGLGADDGEQQRVAGAVDRHAIEQQILDRRAQDDRLEVRRGELGDGRDLLGGLVAARGAEPGGRSGMAARRERRP